MSTDRIRLVDFEGLPADPKPDRNYYPLDLFAPVPPIDWIVENVLVAGEATLLVADGGVGKSFFALALSLAVAGGDRFVGNPVTRGRVVYVDEEGSPSLALQRMEQLGATIPAKRNIDYLSFQGIDLVREPEKLIEDCWQADPVLVVLDSHAKVARMAEENSNSEMSRVWDEGITKLARTVGCAVLVIHHTRGSDDSSRGATQIRNSADQVLTMKRQQDGSCMVWPSKPRRPMDNWLHFNFHKDDWGHYTLSPHARERQPPETDWGR